MTASKNHMFFSYVKKEVEKLAVSTIIGKYTKVQSNRMSDHDALCPLHGDTAFGNFKINNKKGIFKCFACSAYGDGIQFVKDLFQIEFKPAVLKIGVDQGIITETQANEYLGGKISDLNINTVAPENMKAKEKVNGITKIAIPSIRNWAYKLFLMGTFLSEQHRNYLKDRGLSDDEINDKGFFTFPEPTDTFLDGLYKRCEEAGLTSNIFKRIPGFYSRPSLELDTYQPKTGEKEYLYTFAKQRGIGIPVKDARGNIIGIQIRKDKVGEKKKRYTWFSSSYTAYDDNDYIFGTPAGAPTHVAYPKENRYPGVVFITEGFFKAEEIAKTFGSICISMSGVGNYRSVNEDLKAIEICSKQKVENIYVSYDADMSQNLQVYNHAKNMVSLIKEEFDSVEMFISLWNEKDGKGIDDLIHNNKANTLKRVDFKSFSNKYDGMVDELLKQYPIVNRIPKEVVEKNYFETVFPAVYAG